MKRKRTPTKVTAALWKRFQKHVTFWQLILGLQDWNVTCALADANMCQQAGCQLNPEEVSFSMAWVCEDAENRLATVYLREEWEPAAVSQDEVDKAAFHEMCHVLLTPLENFANVGVAEQITAMETHRIIRVLENTFYESYKDSTPK